MFRIAAITRVGVVAVVCVAVAAPQALAKSPVKGGRAKLVRVQKRTASSSNLLRAGLSNAYAQGCENGTLPDRTMGGDNMNYEYFGDVCTIPVPTVPSLTARSGSDAVAATPAAGTAGSNDNTNYEYYGANGS